MQQHNYILFVLFQKQDKCKENQGNNQAVQLQFPFMQDSESVDSIALSTTYPNVIHTALEMPRLEIAKKIMDHIQMSGGKAGLSCPLTRSVMNTENPYNTLVISKHIDTGCWPKDFPFNRYVEVLAIIYGLTARIVVLSPDGINNQEIETYRDTVENSGELFVMVSSFNEFVVWFNLIFQP